MQKACLSWSVAAGWPARVCADTSRTVAGTAVPTIPTRTSSRSDKIFSSNLKTGGVALLAEVNQILLSVLRSKTWFHLWSMGLRFDISVNVKSRCASGGYSFPKAACQASCTDTTTGAKLLALAQWNRKGLSLPCCEVRQMWANCATNVHCVFFDEQPPQEALGLVSRCYSWKWQQRCGSLQTPSTRITIDVRSTLSFSLFTAITCSLVGLEGLPQHHCSANYPQQLSHAVAGSNAQTDTIDNHEECFKKFQGMHNEMRTGRRWRTIDSTYKDIADPCHHMTPQSAPGKEHTHHLETWTNSMTTLINWIWRTSQKTTVQMTSRQSTERVLFSTNHVQFLQCDDVKPFSRIVRDCGNGTSDACAI